MPGTPLRRETALMTIPAPVLVWLRNDLRLADNPALAAACATGPVVVVYILDEDPGIRAAGAASRWWLDKSLRALSADIARAGGKLTLRRGGASTVIADLVAEVGARGVYWNRLYDQPSVDRDHRLRTALEAGGLECREFNAGVLNEPWKVTTLAGAPYKVFTPYWRAARQSAEATRPQGRVTTMTTPARRPVTDSLDSWRLHPTAPDWSTGFDVWRPGEAGAWATLNRFLDGSANAYLTGRDRPDQDGVSRLSAHLRFGEIGPRQVWAATQARMATGEIDGSQAEGFLRQLGWRDFNHQLLFHFPRMARSSFDVRFDAMTWLDDAKGLEAWKRGRTGFPIVDAGMRQLWSTGWMHNRVRMIVASFLVKDLMIDWRIGEAWFWDTLVDADLANNIANWQWVAGSGADAAPYYRVFNPMLQGEKFDPEGNYVRHWVPELTGTLKSLKQEPRRADQGGSSVTGYPQPIVNHAAARERALAAYERVR